MRNIIAGIFLLTATALPAADAPDYRAEFKAGEESAKAGDRAGYLQHMTKAVELNQKPMNRPFFMYHLARALALNGKDEEAVAMLGKVLDERIESLMISYAAYDPAFAATRQTAAYKALEQKMEGIEITATPLSPNLYLLDGAGCNLVASVGTDGTLLVDSGYEPAWKSIQATLRKLGGDRPLRFIVNTHEHEDHVGGNAKLGATATIVGDRAIRDVLSKEQTFIEGVVLPPKPEASLPDVMPDDRLVLHFNGEDIVVVRLTAHSSSDLAVWFRGSKVLHMGDDYFPGTSLRINPGEADPLRFITTLDALLAEVPDDAKVVSGHSPVVAASELKKVLAETKRIRDFVRDGRAAKKDLATLQSEGKPSGIPADWVEFFFEKMK